MANAGTYFRIMEKCRILFLRLYSFVCDYVGDSQLDKTPYCDRRKEISDQFIAFIFSELYFAIVFVFVGMKLYKAL